MDLKKSFTISVVLALTLVLCWELYWRNQGFTATLDDGDDLWVIQREKVDELTYEDVILIGSSRAYFDLQLNPWEEIYGRRPVQLSIEGSSPQYVFDDLVNNTDFSGFIVIGVTEGLFFSTLYPEAPPNEKPLNRIDYMDDRTYAQKLNHFLYNPLENIFAFISNDSGTDGTKLESLLDKVKLGDRVPDPMLPFHKFSQVDKTRNLRMTQRTVEDTAFAASIQRVWMFFSSFARENKPEKDVTMGFFIQNLEKFKQRGGEVVLLRCPSTGKLREFELETFPRSEFWDPLVENSGVPAYYFEDHPELSGFDCPEWSHLSGEDADVFTDSFVRLLMRDGILKRTSDKHLISRTE